jgi:hypothetical protein
MAKSVNPGPSAASFLSMFCQEVCVRFFGLGDLSREKDVIGFSYNLLDISITYKKKGQKIDIRTAWAGLKSFPNSDSLKK